MKVQRGDVVVVDFPFTDIDQSKPRPALVVLADAYNQRTRKTIVALITTNLRFAKAHCNLFIDLATPAGVQSGLKHSSVITCINLLTVEQDDILKILGTLPDPEMQQIDACMKNAFDLP